MRERKQRGAAAQADGVSSTPVSSRPTPPPRQARPRMAAPVHDAAAVTSNPDAAPAVGAASAHGMPSDAAARQPQQQLLSPPQQPPPSQLHTQPPSPPQRRSSQVGAVFEERVPPSPTLIAQDTRRSASPSQLQHLPLSSNDHLRSDEPRDLDALEGAKSHTLWHQVVQLHTDNDELQQELFVALSASDRLQLILSAGLTTSTPRAPRNPRAVICAWTMAVARSPGV